MRILLDESVPRRLGRLLAGHVWSTVQREGWTSIKNGRLLALASIDFDVLLTADKGMEHQQNQANLPVAVLVVRARSNRYDDLAAEIPAILQVLNQLLPRTLCKVGTADGSGAPPA